VQVKSVSWIGVQTDAYDEMVRFCKEALRLQPDTNEEKLDLTDFPLPNGDSVTVYGPSYKSDRPFTTGPVPAFFVEDAVEARKEMETVGVEFIGPTGIGKPPWEGWAYALFRAPDGNLYRIMSRPDPS
jgi:hypothetical protein